MTERADQQICINAPAHSTALVQAFFFVFFWGGEQNIASPLQLIFGSLRRLVFRNAKIAVESEEICECDGHTVHTLSQRLLAADLLAPRESDYSRMRSKVSPNWLPNYTKVTQLVLEIFKMAGYFPDRPRM
jgi:hypothetical protein